MSLRGEVIELSKRIAELEARQQELTLELID